MTVLLLEDHHDARLALCHVLRAAGVEVIPAASIDEAFTVIERGDRFEAALLDLMLPDGCGLVVLEKLQKERPACRLVAMSADDQLLELARVQGAREVYSKPFFDLPGLVAAVLGETEVRS